MFLMDLAPLEERICGAEREEQKNEDNLEAALITLRSRQHRNLVMDT